LAKDEPVPERMVEVFHDGARRRMPLYLREALRHGHRFAGPAVVAQEDATTCIPAGFDAHCDAHGNLLLEAS
jgi:N-methylhydantoinase A